MGRVARRLKPTAVDSCASGSPERDIGSALRYGERANVTDGSNDAQVTPRPPPPGGPAQPSAPPPEDIPPPWGLRVPLPITEWMEGNKRSRAWFALYALSLAASVVFLFLAFGGDDLWMGEECSFETGYEHSIGFMRFVPWLSLLGLFEAVIAIAHGVARRWPWKVALWLGLIAGGVMVISFAAFVGADYYVYQHACD
jgi:hypothetical protein